MNKNSPLLVVFACLTACGGAANDSPSSAPPPPPEQIPLPAAAGTVIFMGDSITQYWGGGPPTYPAVAITTLMPGAIDAGIAGETTEQMQQRFATDVMAKNPAVVVILGGTNDLRLEQNPSTDAIAAMADTAATAGAHVVIGTVPPSELWLGSTFLTQAETIPAIKQFNSQLTLLASAHGYLVADYYSAMVNSDGSSNQNLFLSDHIHPNSDGYAVMWSALRPMLATLESH
jgi:lysophospholipase L1-like esterase